MGEAKGELDPHIPRQAPILIICPEPGFKTSYFDEHELLTGFKKFLWRVEKYRYLSKFEKNIADAYMNMSYTLGVDWNILLFNEE